MSYTHYVQREYSISCVQLKDALLVIIKYVIDVGGSRWDVCREEKMEEGEGEKRGMGDKLQSVKGKHNISYV